MSNSNPTFPFNTSTSLSFEKIATLVQGLVALQEKTVKLPGDIQNSISELLSAQDKLVKSVDDFLHSEKRNIGEFELVKTIVTTCPEFLGTKDESVGGLPIYWFASNFKFCAAYVPLLAQTGLEYGIGGVEGRGGILVKNDAGWNVLQCLTGTSRQSSDVMKLLSKAHLLRKEDVRKYFLLHEAVKDENLEMVKYMIELDSSCLDYSDKMNNYSVPITYVCTYDAKDNADKEAEKNRLEIVKCLIKGGIKLECAKFRDNKGRQLTTDQINIGGLFEKAENGEFVLDCLIERFGEEIWDSIEEVLSSFADLSLPILHKTIKHCPQYFSTVFSRFPEAITARDSDNRLPVHISLETGMKWSFELLAMIQASRPYLKDMDPVSKCPPFILASLDERSCDLRTIFFLLRKHPEHLETFLGEKKSFIHVHSNKRRKIN